ncbi:expressed unknown protein [Seminavis robusta]|uniref:PDZ domain-containing protein n=1 Tax=Seminavis robusta TaxID=568900 RepID=A0A9N8E9Q6_9STRA|nr:expressed unknown protein [Seminavis robusta]|eukprot:Sro853_g211110.1 n/a (199) ;mRNA; r:12526-13122
MVNHRFSSTVDKPYGAKTGISLKDGPGGFAVVVSQVHQNSLFQGTSVREGQMVLTINGVSAKRRHARDLSEVIQKTQGALEIVTTTVPPGAMPGGQWGYKEYGQMTYRHEQWNGKTETRWNPNAKVESRQLYKAPDGNYYLEDGRVRRKEGADHPLNVVTGIPKPHQIFFKPDDPKNDPYDFGPSLTKFAPHSAFCMV